MVNGTLTVNKATLTVTADNKTKLLNAVNPTLTASYSGFKNSDSLATSTTGSPSLATTAITTSPVGSYSISATQGTLAGSNYTFNFVNGTLTVKYAGIGVCDGDAGHQILQPINVDGTSVFKQKSTVPAKFRVCDANGASIGIPGLVTSFYLMGINSGSGTLSESVDSTTPDTAFRWDPTAQQWIFNMSTKSSQAGLSYYYEITLNDGTKIDFYFGLK